MRWSALALLLAAASVAIVRGGVADSPAIATPVVQKGETFTCTPIAVWDGDGPIWCSEGPRIRLSGIAAREMDETCSAGHPCPDASGIAARDELVGLLGGPKGTLPTGHIKVAAPPLRCVSKGSGKGSRTAAFCQRQDGVDLSCAMVSSGKALRWQRYWGNHICP
jgi:endonuclease YncB( thermonuclease family)